MSAAPWRDRLERLAVEAGAVETQKLSTGSASSSTSMPRARNPSSCGRWRGAGVVAGEIVDRGLVLAQLGDVVLERAPALGVRRGREARQLAASASRRSGSS